jgi:hypothetical protein
MPLLNSSGYKHFLENLVYPRVAHLSYGVTILERRTSLPTQCFMLVQNTLRWTIILFEKELLQIKFISSKDQLGTISTFIARLRLREGDKLPYR